MGHPAGETPVESRLRVVDDQWHDAAAHDQLLASCELPSDLRHVAIAYRRWSNDPARAAVSRRQLQRITAIALARLDSPASNRRPIRTSRVANYALLALLLLGSVLLLRLL